MLEMESTGVPSGTPLGGNALSQLGKGEEADDLCNNTFTTWLKLTT